MENKLSFINIFNDKDRINELKRTDDINIRSKNDSIYKVVNILNKEFGEFIYNNCKSFAETMNNSNIDLALEKVNCIVNTELNRIMYTILHEINYSDKMFIDDKKQNLNDNDLKISSFIVIRNYLSLHLYSKLIPKNYKFSDKLKSKLVLSRKYFKALLPINLFVFYIDKQICKIVSEFLDSNESDKIKKYLDNLFNNEILVNSIIFNNNFKNKKDFIKNRNIKDSRYLLQLS